MAPPGDLFDGIKFWVSSRTPSRKTMIEYIENYGGIVVPLEKLADMNIVDHVRKATEFPPNSYSYKFIDLSVRNGRLENKEDHAVQRIPTGANLLNTVHQAAKTTRTQFTEHDDIYLREWVASHPSMFKQGNKIFQELAAQNNRHTYQSWRDRWVRRVQYQPTSTQTMQHVNTPPTPPTDPSSDSGPSVTADRAAPSRTQASRHTASARIIPAPRPMPTSTIQSKPPTLSSVINGKGNTTWQEPPPMRTPTLPSSISVSRQGIPVQTSRTNADAPITRRQPLVNDLRHASVSSRHSTGTGHQDLRMPVQPEKPIIAHAPQVNDMYIQGGDSNRIDDQSYQYTSKQRQANTIRQPTSVSNPQPRNDPQIESSRSQITRTEQARQRLEASTKVAHASSTIQTRTPEYAREQKPKPVLRSPVPVVPRTAIARKQTTREDSEPVSDIDDTLILPPSDDDADVIAKHIPPPKPARQSAQPVRAVLPLPDKMDEAAATQVWADMLEMMRPRNPEDLQDSAYLLANAHRIQKLDDDTLIRSWNVLALCHPHRTYDEWTELYNRNLKFYKEYVQEFVIRYQNRLQVSKTHGNQDKQFKLGPRLVPGTAQKMQEARTRASLPTDSPIRERSIVTPPPKHRQSRRRGRSRSEVPESPESPSYSRKRRRLDIRSSPPAITQTQQHDHTADIEIEDDDQSAQDFEDILHPFLNNASIVNKSHPRPRLPSESLTDPDANIIEDDEQEERDRITLSTSEARAMKVNANDTSSQRNTDEPNQAVHDMDEEESSFVSEDEDDMPKNNGAKVVNDIFVTPPPISGRKMILPVDEDYEQEVVEAGRPAKAFHTEISQTRRSIPRAFVPESPTAPIESSRRPVLPTSSHEIGGNDDDSDFDDIKPEDWLDHKRKAGYSDEVLFMMLDRTTLNCRIANPLLTYYSKYGKIPTSRKGCWTEEDDADLQKNSRLANKALAKKHGKEALDPRRKHLHQRRQAELRAIS